MEEKAFYIAIFHSVKQPKKKKDKKKITKFEDTTMKKII